MALNHDTYLLDWQRFKNTLAQIHDTKVDAAARIEWIVDMYIKTAPPSVMQLADRYGAWEPRDILATLAEVPDSIRKIRFLQPFVLYAHLSYGSYRGLGHGYQQCYTLLMDLGWSETDAQRLIFGDTFDPPIEINATSARMGVLHTEAIQSMRHQLANTPERPILIKLAQILQQALNDNRIVCHIISG